MAGDVDFVTVGATWIHGRADFEIWHMRLLSGRFKESTNTPSETFVRFIRPDFAVIDGSWFIQSDKNAAGSARTKRFGLMSMLAEKRKGSWLVVAAQNTNGELGRRSWMTSSDRLSPPDPIQTHHAVWDFLPT